MPDVLLEPKFTLDKKESIVDFPVTTRKQIFHLSLTALNLEEIRHFIRVQL